MLDNLATQKKKHGTWLSRHPHEHFHYTPTSASWLNQIEVWSSTLTTRAIRHGSFTSPRQLRDAITRFTEAYNEDCDPFERTKPLIKQVFLKQRYVDLCK